MCLYIQSASEDLKEVRELRERNQHGIRSEEKEICTRSWRGPREQTLQGTDTVLHAHTHTHTHTVLDKQIHTHTHTHTETLS